MHQSQIPQCTDPISTMHRSVTQMCTFRLQNGALWNVCLKHCGIHEIGLYPRVYSTYSYEILYWSKIKYPINANINNVWYTHVTYLFAFGVLFQQEIDSKGVDVDHFALILECWNIFRFDQLRVPSWHTPWWRHQMETFSALPALCVGKPPVTSGFPSQRPVTLSFGVFLGVCLKKRLTKQSICWWFGTSWCSLRRHCNVAWEVWVY